MIKNRIPTCFKDTFEKKINKLVSAGKKIGQPVSYRYGDTYIAEVKDGRNKYDVEFVDVIIEGTSPVIEGWEFLAYIERRKIGNTVQKLDDNFDATPYYNSGCHCDHCNTKRSRIYLYLVRNVESGEVKQVGKSCLKDFLGYHANPENILKRINDLLFQIEEAKEKYDSYGSSIVFTPQELLKTIYAIVQCYGYGNSQSSHPTSGVLGDVLFPSRETDECKRRHKELIARIKPFEDNAKVEEMMEFFKNFEPRGDFEHNVKVVVCDSYAKWKDWSLLCYAPVLFDRKIKILEAQKKRDEQRQEEIKTSNHFGEAKTRYERELTFKGVITTVCSQWGSSRLMKFVDADGNVFKWFCSSDYFKTDELGTFKAKFTVKKHNEYKGLKETIVNRLVVLK
jgi:hypothetical protein